MPAQLEQWFEHKVHTITQFLNAKNVFAAEIHYQQVEIYGEDVMSWYSLTKWCTHFQTGTVMEDCLKKKKKSRWQNSKHRIHQDTCGKCNLQSGGLQGANFNKN